MPGRTAKCRSLFVVLALCSLPPGAAFAQGGAAPAESLTPVFSLGHPPAWKPFFAGSWSLDQQGDTTRSGAVGTFGLYKDLKSPIVGIGASGEAYLDGYSGRRGPNGGVRVMADLRSVSLKVGVDYSFRHGETSLILSMATSIVRGGLFGRGTQLRVDWIPGRGQQINVGLQVPLEPHMGRTRPRHTQVGLPAGTRPASPPALPPAIAEAMKEAREAARGMTVLVAPFWPDDRANEAEALARSQGKIRAFAGAIDRPDSRRPNGATIMTESAVLHAALDRAFGIAAAGADSGRAVADLARSVALDDVLYPYNRLFGQFKSPDRLWGLGRNAREHFAAKLASIAVAATDRAAVQQVFDDYVALLEESRGWWGNQLQDDARLMWLPFPLALRPEQYDTQAELDAILSRAQGTPLVGGNAVLYLSGQQFEAELRRTIRQAEDYHVLWLHDYDGVDGAGNPDSIGYDITVEGYLAALTARVREFDRTGRLPTYMILVDLNFFEANQGRIYTKVLADPLSAAPALPRQSDPANRQMQAGLDRALRELRAAVAGSARLQAEAVRRGKEWLRKYVAVHVNVMNPADFSYRTHRVVGYMPFAPDALMRDHRKIAFRDLSESDPGKGEAYFAGVGVGEQYMTTTWEDRAVRLTGPAALTLKASAREYLKVNGVRDAEMPVPLRAQPLPADYGDRVKELEARSWTATAAQVQNEVGFGPKPASIASVVLYTMVPAGSVIVVPDSIWTHELWAAYLVGAALRGCHVYIIAPSLANAPSAGFPQMSRSREILLRLLEIQRILGPSIAARGGSLRTGLYTRRAGVADIKAKFAELHDTFTRYPFLREDFPFPASFYGDFARAAATLEAGGYTDKTALPADAVDRAPKLHRKTQLFITRPMLNTFVADARVHQVIGAQLTMAVKSGIVTGTVDAEDQVQAFRPLYGPLVEACEGAPAAVRDETVMYMTVGSLNKDARGMMTDGEALQITSGPWAAWAIPDIWMLVGSTTWVENRAQFDRLIPPYPEWQRRVGRWLRKVL